MSLSGALEKMSIIAYEDDEYTKKVDEITVQFNPTNYGTSKKHNYTQTPAIGGVEILRFGNEEAEQKTFEFIFDQTVMNPIELASFALDSSLSVESRIEKFNELVYQVNGNSHVPNYLLLSWGSLQFRCFCESIDIDYKHFDNGGVPVRAEIKAQFKEFITYKQYLKKVQKNSPDMTHHKVMSAGETLPAIANEIYKDPGYYIQLAEFNDLDSFRNIKLGTQITVPPLKA